VRRGELETTAIYVDTFGNVKLAGVTADLVDAIDGLEHGDDLEVRLNTGRAPTGDSILVRWSAAFGGVEEGEFLLYEDSYGRLCVARNQGSAAQALTLQDGATVVVRRPSRADGSNRRRRTSQAAE
jgi:hypothetical protein